MIAKYIDSIFLGWIKLKHWIQYKLVSRYHFFVSIDYRMYFVLWHCFSRIILIHSTENVERSEADTLQERRDLAVEFIFCLVLIEVLRQLSFHPGQDDLVTYIENLAFKHFKYREG